jgi:hypothetical protein
MTDFYANTMIENCSAECPQECDSMDYSITTTFSQFPAPSFLYSILGNDFLASKYFNMNGSQFRDALNTSNPNLVPSTSQMATTMKGKLVKLNIFFNELLYTSMEESAKFEEVDLISNLGGTIVTFN